MVILYLGILPGYHILVQYQYFTSWYRTRMAYRGTVLGYDIRYGTRMSYLPAPGDCFRIWSIVAVVPYQERYEFKSRVTSRNVSYSTSQCTWSISNCFMSSGEIYKLIARQWHRVLLKNGYVRRWTLSSHCCARAPGPSLAGNVPLSSIGTMKKKSWYHKRSAESTPLDMEQALCRQDTSSFQRCHTKKGQGVLSQQKVLRVPFWSWIVSNTYQLLANVTTFQKQKRRVKKSVTYLSLWVRDR